MIQTHALLATGLLLVALPETAAFGQPGARAETVAVHEGSIILRALLWRPPGQDPFPATLLNHGSGHTREDLERLGPYEGQAEALCLSSRGTATFSCSSSGKALGCLPTRVPTPLT